MLESSIAFNDESQVAYVLSAGSGSQPARTGPSRTDLALLVERMAMGQQDALASLYDDTGSLLNGLLLRFLERPEDAEEALADVYMKAWKNAASYSPDRGSVQSWLVIMARSIAIDRIRQKRAQPKIVTTTAHESGNPLEFISDDASPEEEAGASQRRKQVQRVLAELPSEQRQVVMMAFFGGLSHSELAAKLGQPLGTVKSRVRTALLRLRSLLEGGPSLER